VEAQAEIVVGPMLRYVGTTTATVWLETSRPCAVTILGHSTKTFHVEGHHYALVVLEGLEPGTTIPYEVDLDGRLVWPEDDERPRSVIRTRMGENRTRLAFGSCRLGYPERVPYTLSSSEDDRGVGTDALWAYSKRLQGGAAEWPDAIVLLGDQVYADEVSPETAEYIRTTRDVGQPPGEQIADFEEFTRLYREAWSDPDVRWLLSTVPSAMIFDDHDVHDDWNISEAWVAEMHETTWWEARITGAFMAYWLYQHVGNLSPDEVAADGFLHEVQADADGGPRLREQAKKWDRDRKSSRWAYHRDFGRSRLLVIDCRAGRVVDDDGRAMINADEWSWIVEHAHGSYDHLVIVTTLPAFLPHGIHFLEAWNEAVCDGAWGRFVGRLAERLRRAVDLEHWAAYQRSFHRLVDLLRSLSNGLGGDAPASIVILGGDVHMTYVAAVDLGEGAGPSAVVQVVCSPFRNPLDTHERRVVRVTGSRAVAAVFSQLARICGVKTTGASWKLTTQRTFDNSIGELALEDRRMTVTLFHAGSYPETDLTVAHRERL
jgi:phosphodiesterase/alkaline phosphatase D-like protein